MQLILNENFAIELHQTKLCSRNLKWKLTQHDMRPKALNSSDNHKFLYSFIVITYWTKTFQQHKLLFQLFSMFFFFETFYKKLQFFKIYCSEFTFALSYEFQKLLYF